MYSVSDQYKTAMKQPVQRFRMTGTAGDLSFSDENILSGSFHLTNQCSDDTNPELFMTLDSNWKSRQIIV